MATETKAAGASQNYDDGSGMVDSWTLGASNRIGASDNVRAGIVELTADIGNEIYGPSLFLRGYTFGFTAVTGTVNQIAVTIEKLGTNVCFPAGTLVSTPNGEVSIEKLKVGDDVLSWSRTGVKESKVTKLHERTSHSLRILITDKGTLTVTNTHPFKTDRGKIQSGKIVVGDVLYKLTNKGLEKCYVQGVILLPQVAHTVYNLTVTKPNTYFANGFAVYNKLETYYTFDYQVKLFDDTGVPAGADKAVATEWPTTDTNVTYTWSEAEVSAAGISAADVLDVDFGAGIAVRGTQGPLFLGDKILGAHVDYMETTVTYTADAAGTPLRMLMGMGT